MAIIDMFHGEKGGVGKSFVADTYIDNLLNKGEEVIIIDADQSNGDVYRKYSTVQLENTKKKELEIHRYDLGEKDGWWDLYNLMNEKKDVKNLHIVINFPAQIEYTMKAQRKEFGKALDTLGYKLNMIWTLNEEIDSVQLLKNTTINNKELIDKLIIVKNGFFADEDEFSDWTNSNIRKELLKREDVKEVFLPELNRRLRRALKQVKKPFFQALTCETNPLDFSEKMGLESWLDEARLIFASIE